MPDINYISDSIAAIAALGTASFGLVDATKSLGGGISRIGFGDIKAALKPFYETKNAAGIITTPANPKDHLTPTSYGSVLSNLRSNWMNGTVLADQKAIAKTLIKLYLSAATAPQLAARTGVDPVTLTTIATSINSGTALTAAEADAFGRFDVALTSLFDQAYQRADQRYRNACKGAAGLISIVLAIIGGWIASSGSLAIGPLHGAGTCYWFTANMGFAALAGALATPLAPIAKDLTSALVAGVNVAQKLTNK